MTVVSFRAFLAASSVAVLLLAGCGSSGTVAPTLLVQSDVNGAYNVSASNTTTSSVMYKATFTSTPPKAESGPGYVVQVTGAWTPTAVMDLGPCNGSTFQLAGTITNPNVNDVDINMTGSTPGGGTMTLSGSVLKGSDQILGTVVSGNYSISGGSCPVESMPFVAIR